jgi:hypothetical protein
LDRPGNAIGRDAEGMVDGSDHQVVLLLRHVQPPIRRWFSGRCVEAVQSPDKESDRYECGDLCDGLFHWNPRCFESGVERLLGFIGVNCLLLQLVLVAQDED